MVVVVVLSLFYTGRSAVLRNSVSLAYVHPASKEIWAAEPRPGVSAFHACCRTLPLLLSAHPWPKAGGWLL